jgi:hypothetical protein
VTYLDLHPVLAECGMGYRRFTDRDGVTWEVRDASRAEWELVPVSTGRGRAVRVRAPSYESDPFEVSTEELQRLLEAAGSGRDGPTRRNPFGD